MMLAVVMGFLWKDTLGDELLLLLQPPYRANQVDPIAGTMTMEGVSEVFVVRCHDLCKSFVVGGRYPMLYRGSTLEFRSQGGEDSEQNLITLCVECHYGHHNFGYTRDLELTMRLKP